MLLQDPFENSAPDIHRLCAYYGDWRRNSKRAGAAKSPPTTEEYLKAMHTLRRPAPTYGSRPQQG